MLCIRGFFVVFLRTRVSARGWGRSCVRRRRAMSRVRGLQCRECGHLYGLLPIHVCELCFGPLEVAYDYDAIRELVSREAIAAGPQTMWRYRALLPIDDEPIIETYAGWTPLVKAENLGRLLGLRQV